MIWRLLASVLAITDTGGIAVTSENSNWPTEQQCLEVVARYYASPPPQQIAGHTVTMKVSTSCVAVEFAVKPGPIGPEIVVSGPCGFIAGRVPLPGCLPPEVNQNRYGGPPYTR